MKSYLEKHRRTFGLIGALIAFVIAVIYLRVTPEEASEVSGIKKIIIDYGHSVCWFFLGVASLLWGVQKRKKWSITVVYGALITYIIFITTLLLVKSA